MKKGENSNHPETGAEIKVDPIRNLDDIKKIKKLLKDKPRDLCLFVFGTNTNLRASDLLRITAGMVKNLKPMDDFEIREQKTGKARRVTVNKSVVEAIKALLKSRQYKDDEPLFIGERGTLTVPSVNRLVKQWCGAINLAGNYGSHTLRKTWGYHQRVTYGRGLAELVTCFNHSCERQTLSYLCVQPSELKSIFANEI